MNKLILVDGSSYLHRAFHALPPLTTSQGIPTGAVYGVVSMLKSLLKEYQPLYGAVIFDGMGKTFREELYPEYKANRAETPHELVTQFPLLYRLVQALGFPALIAENVEADDVIGTLAKQAEQQGMQVLIFTGDKDFAQLVNDQIMLIDTMKGTRLDVQGVKDKFGIPPELMIDYLTLTGDSVDNVPGVDKVGPKTALKWLQEFGSLTAIVEQATEIKGKVGENLRMALKWLPLSRQLLTIQCTVPLPYTIGELQLQLPNLEILRTLYNELEFKQWLAELPSDVPVVATRYSLLLNQEDFTRWLAQLNQVESLALTVKSTSSDFLQAHILGIAIALNASEIVYIPLAHDYIGVPQQLSPIEVLAALKPILENPQIRKIGHHLKQDAHLLANYGIHLQGMVYDTLLESYILESTLNSHELPFLASKYLGKQLTPFSELVGKGKKQLAFSQLTIETAGDTAATEVAINWQLHNVLWEKLQAVPALLPDKKIVGKRLIQVLTEIECPLIPILVQMERTGILIDLEALHRYSQELADKLQTLEQQVYNLVGETVNLNSPKQLQTLLFEKLQVPSRKKTAKGVASTSLAALEELANDYPVVALILEHRSLSKLKSTYTDALPRQLNPHTQRIHTSYQQAIAITGRLTSINPNLQNIPIRTPEGRRIRQAFIAPSGKCLLAADYSQIELRIMAHLSGDTKLYAAFHSNQDVHRYTAAEVFNVDLDQVTSEQRRTAKIINFGLIYGMGATSLAKQLNVERREAQTYIDMYFTRYPQVKVFMESMREMARRQGYVETIFRRRLYIPEINSRDSQRQQYAERSAINAPMQGSSADLIKLAMIAVDHWLKQTKVDALMLLQVHDELVLEVAENDIEAVKVGIRQIMSEIVHLEVPLVVEMGEGSNWDEAH